MDFDDVCNVIKVLFFIGLAMWIFSGLKGCCADMDREQSAQAVWCTEHHTTMNELSIFARIMNVSPNDVIASKGLQAEFERFENGDLRQTGQETHQEGKHSVTRNTFH